MGRGVGTDIWVRGRCEGITNKRVSAI